MRNMVPTRNGGHNVVQGTGEGTGGRRHPVGDERVGEGHAVLTVKTDKGEFVLDNQNENVLAWTDTGYRFVKRQSQSDPNVWVSLGDNRPAVATASSRDR